MRNELFSNQTGVVVALVTDTAPSLKPQEPGIDSERVVYLLGAGATQGCASFVGSTSKLVMPGLIDQLTERMRELVYEKYESDAGIRRLVNEVVDEKTDFEQLITFLEDTPSKMYQSLAGDLKDIFSSVLRSRLDAVRDRHGERHSELYAVLLDMHTIGTAGERLEGFLTLNYDSFLEHAIEVHHGQKVDFGVAIEGGASNPVAKRVLKLHGSFGWDDGWPIQATTELLAGLWIPPGIRKTKEQYPFNAIWGMAREMLDCDVVRIVGCNLGPNDWDLVSLLFTTMHTHENDVPYRIEVIAGPKTAETIAELFPYLKVMSLLEIPSIGPHVVSEVLGVEPQDYANLDDKLQGEARKNAQSKIGNPFEYWLKLKGEMMLRDLDSIATDSGMFERFVSA